MAAWYDDEELDSLTDDSGDYEEVAGSKMTYNDVLGQWIGENYSGTDILPSAQTTSSSSGAGYGISRPSGSSGSPSSNLAPTTTTLKLSSIPKFSTSASYGDVDYSAPEYDDERVQELSDEKAMAGRGQLQRGIQSVVGTVQGASDSPILQKYQLGAAFEKFGEGVAKNEAQAETAAENAYAKEFAAKEREAGYDWQAAQQKAESEYTKQYQADLANYQTKLQAWLSGKLA